MINRPPSTRGSHTPRRQAGRRVTQGMIDQMAELRRQGLTFKDIGARVGRSERTARRYVGRVEPRIHLPSAQQNLEPEDARDLRPRLGKSFAAFLHKGWNRWPSAAFLAETNRQVEERLAHMDVQTLRILARDSKIWTQFILEVLGPLYKDFVSCRNVHETIQQFSHNHAPFLWQPPHERAPLMDDAEDAE